MTNETNHRFQVNLKGVIELLASHLYSRPAVFVRELLQNGIDAIEARRHVEPRFRGEIEIEVIEGEPPTLLFRDNGIGLTEEEVHQFLATIGESSKRAETSSRPEDFVGQFGIGLLSCFMVSDEITVLTRSARASNAPVIEWRGKADGTYSVRPVNRDIKPGTEIFIRSNQAGLDLLRTDRIRELVLKYGRYLEPNIKLRRGESWETLNDGIAPWKEDLSDQATFERLIHEASEIFQKEFVDIVPLRATRGDADGLAFILSEPATAGARSVNQAYLKGMLVADSLTDLLPDWAFLLTRSSTPTNSILRRRAKGLSRIIN